LRVVPGRGVSIVRPGVRRTKSAVDL
jgi:hypothetical protein